VIDVIIPTLGRPHRLADLAANIAATTKDDHRVVFVVEESDGDSIAAVADLGLVPVVNRRTANYQGAVNTAYEDTTGEWLFCGADDLVFHKGWDFNAFHTREGYTGRVLGTNDLYNGHVLAGVHSTHSLVHRSYLDELGGVVDHGPGSFLFEGYDHNFCDTEFIATAKMRCEFTPCLDSVVEHLHPAAGKAEFDDTYARSFAGFDRDARLFEMRSSLWGAMYR
jgi:glycosyltransferase involved in cell wall biosynthesis